MKIIHMPTALLFLMATVPLAQAEDTTGYSGITSFMPTHSRTTYYRYKALQNREIGLSYRMGENLHDRYGGYTGQPSQIYSNCSINIGNVVSNQVSGSNENVVIIDGDIINAGRCDGRP